MGVGLVAGAYPAWVVARFQPAAVVRGRSRGRCASCVKGLVVAQFTVTAALLTMTLLMWHQVDYIQDLRREGSALEFEPEQVVVVEQTQNDGGSGPNLQDGVLTGQPHRRSESR